MKLLLDTHALIWYLAGSPSLSTAALTAIQDPANELWLSPISLLEIAINTDFRRSATCLSDTQRDHPDREFLPILTAMAQHGMGAL